MARVAVDDSALFALDDGLFDADAEPDLERAIDPRPSDDEWLASLDSSLAAVDEPADSRPPLTARLVASSAEQTMPARAGASLWPLLITIASGMSVGAVAAALLFQERLVQIFARW